ncbi:MAG: 30S ribosomal protein S20 [Candidatus Omnitrophota bacterium]
MPILPSAFKELRKAKKRHLRNISAVAELKTLNKKFLSLVAEKKLDQAKEVLRELFKRLDKAAAKNIIHKKKAARKKSRLARTLRKS